MRYLHVLLILLFSATPVFPFDTLVIENPINYIDLYRYIDILEDNKNELVIDDIISEASQSKFNPNKDEKINFGYSPSTFWLRLNIRNNTGRSLTYILEVSNSDLDNINFYSVSKDKVNRAVRTGELKNVNSRDIFHRNFLFKVSLSPEEEETYYLSVNNNGHPCSIPISMKEEAFFGREDTKSEIVNWLIYGLLIFMMIFNLYLFRSTKDKVSLFFAISLFFATLSFLNYDGYFFIINPPVFIEKIKWLFPSLYSVFLLRFTQVFSVDNKKKIINKIVNSLKFPAVIAPFAYILKYPFSLIADLGIMMLILVVCIIIVIMIFSSYKKDYLPSRIFFFAFFFVLFGVIIHLFKEFRIINPSFMVINSIKFGLTIQNIFLTIAVLERFRLNQEKAKKTIQDNLVRIEIQNKELEIINFELEKLSIVASETDNGVAIYNKDGVIEWANTGFENLYGLRLGDLIKEKRDRIQDIVPNRNITRYLNNCRDSKLPIVFETQVMLKESREKWIQTTLSPYVRSGKINKIIAIDSDITNLKIYEKELKSAKEKAVEADRLKTAFLGNLSHEIRTPLNGILGFSELLNRIDLADDEKKVYLEIIRSSGEQLMHIIDDIVDISLIESNQMKLFHTEFDLNQLVSEVTDFFESFRLAINKGHIRLMNDVQIKSPYKIRSDPFRLKQVLTNLVKNALKFTQEGFVRIGVYVKGDLIYFYVEDTGIGIHPDKKDIIFQRFRQGEESLNRKFGGTGLGLSISKGIVEKLGGTIWLDMSYTKGFRILFNIPLIFIDSEAQADNHRKKKGLNDKIKNKNILIVEDHDVSYKYLEEILLPYKPKLSWATNGHEAVEMTNDNDYDLVIMDINLPEMNGIDAIREIRRNKPDVPILVQTAHAMETEIDPILESGCNDMIAKPFSEKDLMEKIHNII